MEGFVSMTGLVSGNACTSLYWLVAGQWQPCFPRAHRRSQSLGIPGPRAPVEIQLFSYSVIQLRSFNSHVVLRGLIACPVLGDDVMSLDTFRLFFFSFFSSGWEGFDPDE